MQRAAEVNLALDVDDLPPEARAILKALQGNGAVAVVDLAKRCNLNEHALLDHCEVLFAEGLVEPTDGGLAIQVAESA